jgi:hypothetical protein
LLKKKGQHGAAALLLSIENKFSVSQWLKCRLTEAVFALIDVSMPSGVTLQLSFSRTRIACLTKRRFIGVR